MVFMKKEKKITPLQVGITENTVNTEVLVVGEC